jgi:uncharacterized protein involved in tolerance to divalent cations
MKSFSLQEGKIKKEEEKLLLIKIPKENKQALTAFIKKNHPHQIPELIFLQAEDVDAAYLERVHSFAKKSGK